MDYSLFKLIGIVLVALAGGLLLLLSVVHLDLGPAARLAPYKRWLLASALGSGVLALAMKLMFIFMISYFPEYLVRPLLDASPPISSAATLPVSTHPRRYVWTPLPPQAGEYPRAPISSETGYRWQALPQQAPSPVSNPSTPEKVALGERLFFDVALSQDKTLSCASCHNLFDKGGADGLQTALGIDRQSGTRNTPTVWNAAFQSRLFWDGRAVSLEEQAKGPLINPLEMGMPSFQAVEERVQQRQEYVEAFANAFGPNEVISIDRIAEAIAAYERTLVTPDTPYDRFVRGDLEALSPAQLRGMNLFQSIGCIHCHHGANFSAANLLDDTPPLRIFPTNPTPYDQRYPLLIGDGERGVWRVPSLRNVALTGPWLHNGSVSELEEVVRIMASAQLGRAGHYLLWSEADGTIREINQPGPSDQEVEDIVAFLHALSSDRLTQTDRLASQP